MAQVTVERRIDDFITATVRVIAEHGIAGATTRRIAAEAGAPLPSLHYCFRTKEDLFLAVFEYLAREWTRVATTRQVGNDLTETAIGLLRGTLGWCLEHSDFALAQFELYLWSVRHNESTGKPDKIYGMFIEPFSAILAGAEPRLSEPDARSLATVITTLLDGFVLQWAGNRSDPNMEKAITLACECLQAWIVSQGLGEPTAVVTRA